MCGIVGVFNSEDVSWSAQSNYYMPEHITVFTQLLQLDTIRGKDSTGVFSGENGQANVLKKAVHGYDFCDLKAYERFITAHETSPFLVGHNRAATLGSVNADNAHPFTHGDITLVHNGTLRDYSGLPGYKKFDTDSETVCHAFDTIGYEEALKLIHGAFVFIWYDSSDKKLRIVKNDERPLSFCTIEKEETVYLASEREMLEFVAKRNQLKVEQYYTLKKGKVLIIGEGDVTKWDAHDVELAKPIVKTYNNYTHQFSSDQKALGYSTKEDIMVKYDVVSGDEIFFMVDDYIPYSGGSGFGIVEGHMNHKDKHQVVIHGVSDIEGTASVGQYARGTVKNLYNAWKKNVQLDIFQLEFSTFTVMDEDDEVIPIPEGKFTSLHAYEEFNTCTWCNDPVPAHTVTQSSYDAVNGLVCEGCIEDAYAGGKKNVN